jgi:DNA-binding NarL/FixJ family response regulator
MHDTLARLAMVDDHVLFRKTLLNYLSRFQMADVIFEASDSQDLLDKLKQHTIDILILDIFMPKGNGNGVLNTIRNEYPHIKIIILSMYSDVAFANSLLDIGIHGYISKADEPEELIKAINCARNNRIYRNKIFTEALYWGRQLHLKSNRPGPTVTFDEREKKVIQMLWEEKNNKEIASHLFLSVRSIEKMRQEMKEKFGIKTTVGLLKYALNNKIIDIHPSELHELKEALQI